MPAETLNPKGDEHMTEKTITIENGGPIERLVIPVQPGVIVLRAPNDTGKSQALEAVSKIAGGAANLTKRDGAASGSIQGLGITVSLRQSMRRTGELEAVSLEGKPSITDLVSPPIKDPVAADRARIKALLQLTGAKADFSLFSAIVPSGYGAADVFSSDTEKAEDLVEMAARAKRDLELLSRKQADNAEKAEAWALACKRVADGIDLSAETDSEALQAALEDAIWAQSEITAKAQAAEEAKKRGEQAARNLEAMSLRDRLTIEEVIGRESEARQELELAKSEIDVAEVGVREAEKRLASARAEVERRNGDRATAEIVLNAATEARVAREREDSLLAGWRQTVAHANATEVISPKQVADTEQRVTAARKAIEAGAVARAAKAKSAEARKHAEDAKVHRRAADSLREAAKSTDEVLSAAVNSTTMKVRAGRLITQHPTRGEVFFSERSVGTRWRIAMEEIVRRIRQTNPGRTAIISVCQECWEGMDVGNRLAVHNLALELGVAVYTAESVGDELAAVPYKPERDCKRLYNAHLTKSDTPVGDDVDPELETME